MVAELLVEEIFFVKALVTDQCIQKALDAALRVEQQFARPLGLEKATEAVALKLAKGLEKAFVHLREVADGDALVQIAAHDAEQQRLHQIVQVQAVRLFPVGPHPADARLDVQVVGFVHQAVGPKFLYFGVIAFPLFQDALQYVFPYPALAEQAPVVVQFQRNLVAEDFGRSENGVVELHVLEGMQGGVVDKILDRRL